MFSRTSLSVATWLEFKLISKSFSSWILWNLFKNSKYFRNSETVSASEFLFTMSSMMSWAITSTSEEFSRISWITSEKLLKRLSSFFKVVPKSSALFSPPVLISTRWNILMSFCCRCSGTESDSFLGRSLASGFWSSSMNFFKGFTVLFLETWKSIKNSSKLRVASEPVLSKTSLTWASFTPGSNPNSSATSGFLASSCKSTSLLSLKELGPHHLKKSCLRCLIISGSSQVIILGTPFWDALLWYFSFRYFSYFCSYMSFSGGMQLGLASGFLCIKPMSKSGGGSMPLL
mmetsp:Transcript_1962/g.3143  ORF Transcript_1962/g.3143 Transcript_1962/m.3143 type:complete len:289 (-) Transcript_1962:333-1199(-)